MHELQLNLSGFPQWRKDQFYGYELRDEAGRPFYIGKGQGNRIKTHFYKTARGSKSAVCLAIREIIKRGGKVTAVIVFRTSDESQAFAWEQYRIAEIGRPNLVNKTDGGEGLSGHYFTATHRAKIGAAHKGMKHTLEARAKMSAHSRGQEISSETRLKISRALHGRVPWNKGKQLTDEYKAKISAALTGLRRTKETKAKMAAAQIGHTLGPTGRAKIARANKGRRLSPEARAKMSLARKQFLSRGRVIRNVVGQFCALSIEQKSAMV